MAGHVIKAKLNWPKIRADVSVKENVFNSFLREFGDWRRPGGGRDLLMEETLKQYQILLKRCPELKELQDRIKAFVETK